MRPKILVFAGSIRSGALSAKLAAVAAKEIALADGEVTTVSLADYPLPIYDGDHEKTKGVPDNAQKLARLIAGQNGVFIATPEYNHTLPPLLINTLDWISRIKAGAAGIKYRHKVFAIGGTSDGPIGGARAIIDLRKVLATGLSAIVCPGKIEVGRAQDAFNEAGEFTHEAPQKALKHLVRELIDLSSQFADHPAA